MKTLQCWGLISPSDSQLYSWLSNTSVQEKRDAEHSTDVRLAWAHESPCCCWRPESLALHTPQHCSTLSARCQPMQTTPPLLPHNNTWSQAVLTPHIYSKTASCQTLMDIRRSQSTYPFDINSYLTFFLPVHSYIVIHIHYYIAVQDVPFPTTPTPVEVKILHKCPLPSAVLNSIASNWHCLTLPAWHHLNALGGIRTSEIPALDSPMWSLPYQAL